MPRQGRSTDGQPALNVYLELGGKRQMLGQLVVDGIVGYAGMATVSKLLRWAGDLDGDGKLDRSSWRVVRR